MDVLYSDDAVAIRKYLNEDPQGISHINEHTAYRRTPLCTAAEHNRNDVVDVLIEYGADVNKGIESDRLAPLHIASYCGHIDIINRLLSAGADPNIVDLTNITPIMYAAKERRLNVVKLLTPYTNFNHEGIYGSTIFTYAINSRSKDTFDYAFDFCTNINHIDCDGESYLHWAVIQEFPSAIKFLLKKGIDIHITNNEGEKACDLTTNPQILALLQGNT